MPAVVNGVSRLVETQGATLLDVDAVIEYCGESLARYKGPQPDRCGRGAATRLVSAR